MVSLVWRSQRLTAEDSHQKVYDGMEFYGVIGQGSAKEVKEWQPRLLNTTMILEQLYEYVECGASQ